MSLLVKIRRRFGWKIFLSYLIVTLVAVIVMASAVRFVSPAAFTRRLMGALPLLQTPPLGPVQLLQTTLFNNFQAGITEALVLALLAGLAAAILVSVYVSRQVVAPVKDMMQVSQRIAEGHYAERVNVPGDIASGELDELAELALSFNQMAARLEKTESVRRQMIGDVAHELRTPLTTIKGAAEGLIDGVLPASNETYHQICQEAERMQRVVDDLQELSRVESGAVELNRQVVDLLAVARVAAGRLQLKYQEKAVVLEMILPAGPLIVMVDEQRIEQVLLNLLGNSLQYTPTGGRVRLEVTPETREAVVAVVDNGIGLSSEHIGLIFNRFYRVDQSRSRSLGGSGIGLTIAKSIVEAHSGRMWVASQGEGLGSAFYFSLPLIQGGGGQ